MAVTIKFIGALRHLSGKTQLTLPFHEGLSIRDVVANLGEEVPALKRTFCDNDLNDSRANSLVLINGTEISVLDGYNTKLSDGDEVVFVPVVHGG